MAFGKTVKDPFTTPVGQLIALHTISSNKSEDWGQFMNICDFINTTADGPRDAVKALKKRISKNYNQKEVRYSLSLLEMCMQNCSPTFQSMVLKKEFCKDVLAKLLNPKYNLPMDMQNRILRFIMSWSTQSRGKVDVTEVKELYLEMIKKGIQFPPLDANEETMTEMRRADKQTISDKTNAPLHTEISGQQLSPEQIGKLYSELDVVKMNVRVMSEILLENTPGAELQQDIDLLQDLEKVCREMQARILSLLEIVQNEDVIIELVQVNDDLNNIFLRHTRFLRNRSNQVTNASPENSAENSATGINQPTAPSSELIDLNPMPLPHNQTNGHPPPAAAAAAIPVPVPNVSQQQVPNFDTGSTEPPPPYDNRSNFLYPQMDLLELKEAVNTPFPFGGQNHLPTLPPRSLVYDNVPYPTPFPPATQAAAPFFPSFPATTPFFPLAPHPAPPVPAVPVSLMPSPAETNPSLLAAFSTLSPSIVPLPTQSTNKPSDKPDASNSAPLPNYYELLEFDPLAENNKTEAIYEEIDPRVWKQNKSTC